MKKTLFIISVTATLLSVSVRAQVPPNLGTAGDTGSESLRSIDGGDVDTLIENLLAGRSASIHLRIFSGGAMLQDYAPSAVVRATAEFDPHSRALVATGVMDGLPVLEDFRFVESGEIVHILRDIYLNGKASDLTIGRALPVALESTGTSAVSASAKPAAPVMPQITSVHGYTDVNGDGILDGKVDMRTCGTHYDGGRAVNNQPTIFSWDLYGTNFGSSRGRIQLAGITVPTSAIAQWTPMYIRFYPTVPYNWGAISAVLSLTTSSGTTVPLGVSVVPAIQTRILGQCTWFVALTRLNAGRPPSPTAYPPGVGWNQLTANYAPQLWDQLVWIWSDAQGQHKHTAIITSVSGPTKTGNLTSWTLTIGEANAACNNQITYRTSVFQVQNAATILKTIQSSATTFAPSWYYR